MQLKTAEGASAIRHAIAASCAIDRSIYEANLWRTLYVLATYGLLSRHCGRRFAQT